MDNKEKKDATGRLQDDTIVSNNTNEKTYKDFDDNDKISKSSQNKVNELDSKKKKKGSYASLMSQQLEVPLPDMVKIYNSTFEMAKNGIDTSMIENFIIENFNLSKDKATEIAGVMDSEPTVIDEIKQPSKNEKIWNVADSISMENKVICMDESRKLFKYEDGVYVSNAVEIHLEKKISETAKSAYEEYFVENDIKKTLHRIEYNTAIPKSEFNKNKETIVVKNGLLNINTGELRNHTPDEIYTTKLDIFYDTNAKISEDFDNFLKSTFKGVEWEIDVIQEFFGYCLSEEYFIEGFLILLGEGGNGKGVLLNTLSTFIGIDNISNLSLKQICSDDRFTISDFYGKKVNICGDVSKSKIITTDNIKKLTGRDRIRAEFKNKNPFNFYNTAKIIFAGNQMPDISDSSKGFIDRLNLITFPNRFRNTNKQIPKLEEKCTTPESLSGILTWAIEGYHRLKKNGKFSHQKTYKQKVEELDMKTNSVMNFVDKKVQSQEGNFVPKDSLYNMYKLYARKNNLPIKNMKEFCTKFESCCMDLNIHTTIGQKIINGKRPRGYKDIRVVMN